jgi:hypothetical protein
VFDNKTNQQFQYESFEEFEKLLYKLSRKHLKNKKSAKLISPAKYPKGKTRANDNVECWAGWAAVDIDSVDFGEFDNAEQAIKDHFKDYYYVCYSTASSKREHLKFRLVFPLTKEVQAKNLDHFWFALNKELGNEIDQQTKDRARMFYIPGNYHNAYNFIFTHNGNILNPSELMAKYEYNPRVNSKNFVDRLPKEMQDKILNHRKNQLNNTSITWTDHRDCPFVNKNMLSSYEAISHSDGSGRYHLFYKLMVSIAGKAVKMGYPITKEQIAMLMRQIDRANSNIYEKRPIETEADRALEYAYRNSYTE